MELTRMESSNLTTRIGMNDGNNKIRVIVRTRPYLRGEHEKLALQSDI